MATLFDIVTLARHNGETIRPSIRIPLVIQIAMERNHPLDVAQWDVDYARLYKVSFIFSYFLFYHQEEKEDARLLILLRWSRDRSWFHDISFRMSRYFFRCGIAALSQLAPPLFVSSPAPFNPKGTPQRLYTSCCESTRRRRFDRCCFLWLDLRPADDWFWVVSPVPRLRLRVDTSFFVTNILLTYVRVFLLETPVFVGWIFFFFSLVYKGDDSLTCIKISKN